MKKIAQFQVAEDKDDAHLAQQASPARHSIGQGKENQDSGYHGMTDEEIEQHQVRPAEYQAPTVQLKAPYLLSPPKPTGARSSKSKTQGRQDSQDTFVSAAEDTLVAGQATASSVQSEVPTTQETQLEDVAEPGDEVVPKGAVPQDGQHPRQSNQYSVSASTVAAMDTALEQVEQSSASHVDAEQEASTPSSEASSEHRVVEKKSSLTFASLPAREPIAAKSSIGARASRISHIDRSRMPGTFRDSQMGRQLQDVDAQQDRRLSTETLEEQVKEVSQPAPEVDAAKSFSQTSTQRLQERLAMLGQSAAPPLSKSLPSSKMSFGSNDNVAAPLSQYTVSQDHGTEEDDSWIAPIEDEQPQEGVEVVEDIPQDQQTEIEEPPRQPRRSTRSSSHAQAQSSQPQYPELPPAQNEVLVTQPTGQKEAKPTTNPKYASAKEVAISSPAAGRHDGPLSASKAKLFSVFRSARGIFASSASASAQAKMNMASPRLPGSKSQTSIRTVDPTKSSRAEAQKDHRPQGQPAFGALGNASNDSLNLHKELPHNPRRVSNHLKLTTEAVRKEHEEPRPTSQDSQPNSANADNATSEAADHHYPKPGREEEVPAFPPPPPPKNQTSLLSKPGDLRRPARLTKEQPQSRGKPAPVNIRLRGFQGQGMGPFSSNRPPPAAQTQESMAPPAPSKPPHLSNKTSNSSLASSAQSYKTTATSRPKALEAAARKKEQDEREAHRKAEQKRELERRRAAKAEEERKAEQERKAVEQRAAEEKQQALKQAAEQRKAEAIRRNEQLRAQAAATAARERQPEEPVSRDVL